MKLEKRIELCDSMTPLESEIASYILNNKDEITKLKIQELADILFISKSAIHRLENCMSLYIKHICRMLWPFCVLLLFCEPFLDDIRRF